MNRKQAEKLYQKALEDWKKALSGDMEIYNLVTRPQMGDLVVEKTITRFSGKIHMGFLVGSERNGGNPKHLVIDVFTKKIVEYSNCELVAVQGEGICRYPEYEPEIG